MPLAARKFFCCAYELLRCVPLFTSSTETNHRLYSSSELVTSKSSFPSVENRLQRTIAELTRTESKIFKKKSSNPAPEQAAGLEQISGENPGFSSAL